MPRIRGRSTAEHIADVAGRIFYNEGVEHIAVDRVADLAGVTKRTLYKYFRSKDLLIAAAVGRESPLALQDGPGNPEERINDVFRRLVEFISSPNYRGCPFINAAAILSDVRHPARTVIRQTKERRQAWFRARAVELGARDPDLVADQLLVLFDGALASSSMRGRSDPARAAAAAVPHVLRAALRESLTVKKPVTIASKASAA